MCEVIPANSENAIERAAKAVAEGLLVAFPTDTVYGLGASLQRPKAVLRIYSAKSRPPDKPIPVLIPDVESLSLIAAEMPSAVSKLSRAFWPGPLTIVLKSSPAVPKEVTAGGETVAVRVPNHEIALKLLRKAGAMAVTSANISGFPPPLTAEEVVAQLCDKIEIVLDGGKCPGGIPSTIVDLTGEPPIILREGPIPPSEVLRLAR